MSDRDVGRNDAINGGETDFANEVSRTAIVERIRRDGLDTFPRPCRSRIESDREVAAFLVERLGLVPLKSIVLECRNRFGRERAPSVSAAHRFWVRIRDRLSAETGDRK